MRDPDAMDQSAAWPNYEVLRVIAVTEGIRLGDIGPDQAMACAIAAKLWTTVTGGQSLEHLSRQAPPVRAAGVAILRLAAGALPLLGVPSRQASPPPARTSRAAIATAETAMVAVDTVLGSVPHRTVILRQVAGAFRSGCGDPRIQALVDVLEAHLP